MANDKTKSVIPPLDKRMLIRSLARRGGMKHETSTQYFSDNATEEFKVQFPTYDLVKLRAAFPDVLEIDVATEEDGEGKVIEMVAILKNGLSDLEVPIGVRPPTSTEALIEKVRSHLRSLVDVDSLRETSEVFDGFDEK